MGIHINNNFGRIFGRTNGVIINGSGVKVVQSDGLNNVTIVNGEVFVDGVPLEEYKEKMNQAVIIKVEVQGNAENIENCDEVTVHGSCGKVRTHNGNVHCGDVSGSVSTHNGNIHCGKVEGDVDTHNGNISYVR